MDLAKDFKLSYEALKKNKGIIIPSVIVQVIWILAIILILLYSGMAQGLLNYAKSQEKLKEQGSVSGINPIPYGSQYPNWKNLESKITVENIVILFAIMFLLLTMSFYVTCLNLVLISLIVYDKKWDFKTALNIAKGVFLRYSWFCLLFALIVAVFICIAVSMFFLSIPLLKVNIVLGILSIIITFILFLASFFYLGIRMTFALPYLFLENKTAFNTLKESFAITKNRFKETAFVFLIFTGINVGFGFMGNSFFGNGLELFTAIYNGKFAIVAVLFLLFCFASIIVKIFSHLFIFYSYVDFKKSGISKGKSD